MLVFRSDVCGIICILITYGCVVYADYVVIGHLLQTMTDNLWGAFHALFFNTILFLMIVSHVRAVTSDPGIVPLPTTSLDFSDMHSGQKKHTMEEDGWTICVKCETYRPPRAHHCRICQRCIRRMDHHCPWINNCVGEFNQKFFLQFLFYVGIAAIYSIGLVGGTWIMNSKVKTSEEDHLRIVHSVVLVVESLLFGLFVIAIGCDQLQAIFTDQTAVELIMKKPQHRPQRSKVALMREVFGRGPVLLWLCPLQMNMLPNEVGTTYSV